MHVGRLPSLPKASVHLFGLCEFALALKRIAANTVEKRLLNSRGQPNFNVNFYILNARGDYAGVALYPTQFAVCTDAGPRTLDVEALFGGKPEN